MEKKKILAIGAIILLLVILLSRCSGSKKSVAMDFVEATTSDMNAKKAVSLMSDEYMENTMDQYGAATKRVLIAEMQKNFDAHEEDMEDNYGRHWKANVDYIDGYKDDDGRYYVVLSVTFEGTGGLLGMQDLEDTDELTVALVKEGGKWRVDDLYS